MEDSETEQLLINHIRTMLIQSEKGNIENTKVNLSTQEYSGIQASHLNEIHHTLNHEIYSRGKQKGSITINETEYI